MGCEAPAGCSECSVQSVRGGGIEKAYGTGDWGVGQKRQFIRYSGLLSLEHSLQWLCKNK